MVLLMFRLNQLPINADARPSDGCPVSRGLGLAAVLLVTVGVLLPLAIFGGAQLAAVCIAYFFTDASALGVSSAASGLSRVWAASSSSVARC